MPVCRGRLHGAADNSQQKCHPGCIRWRHVNIKHSTPRPQPCSCQSNKVMTMHCTGSVAYQLPTDEWRSKRVNNIQCINNMSAVYPVDLRPELSHTNWVNSSSLVSYMYSYCPTRHIIGHFGDNLHTQSLNWCKTTGLPNISLAKQIQLQSDGYTKKRETTINENY